MYDSTTLDCSHAPSPQAPLSSSGILQARMLEWLSCPPPLDSPPRDRNSIFRGSCIAGRFFTAEPPGKAPQLMCRMANSYLFYFTIFDTYLFSIPFVGNCLLNSLKSGFAFITSPRSSSFIQMSPLFSYIQKYIFQCPLLFILLVFFFFSFPVKPSGLLYHLRQYFPFSPFIILATIFHMLNLLYIQCYNLSRTDPKGFSFIDFP